MHDSDYVSTNQQHWDDMAHEWVESGRRAWASEPTWGEWGIPEIDLGLIPSDMTGMRAIELGCGTGYISAWMHNRGASVVGVDNSAKQLATAKQLAAEHGADIEFIHGPAESVPYPDGSFDYAVSEYGAALWSDPYVWIPEAHRLLKPGGRLVFLSSTILAVACFPWSGEDADYTLHRPTFEIGRTDWTEVAVDPGGIEFHLKISDWFALFKKTGFTVDRFIELRNPDPQAADRFAIPAQWAHDHPSEQIWELTKT